MCAPNQFLRAVERFGQAPALDATVLTQVLELLARHPDHVASLGLCHVNVSGQSAASPNFRRQAMALIDQARVPAGKLCFEITETASIRDLGEVREFIAVVRARGCKVALDDFGSGLSSFAYLKHLDVDILKIDGLFVRGIADDPLDQAVVRSVTEVGHALGKQVIAEWAETPEITRRLAELGVDAAQGYDLHRPCPLPFLM